MLGSKIGCIFGNIENKLCDKSLKTGLLKISLQVINEEIEDRIVANVGAKICKVERI